MPNRPRLPVPLCSRISCRKSDSGCPGQQMVHALWASFRIVGWYPPGLRELLSLGQALERYQPVQRQLQIHNLSWD